MKRLIVTLFLLAVLLPGCAIPAAFGATAWACVQTAATIVRVVDVVWSEKAESEEVKVDGEETQNPGP